MRNLNNRINKLERIHITDITKLSNAELEEFVGEGDPVLSDWLNTITDDELETIVFEKRGWDRIMGSYDEYQNKN